MASTGHSGSPSVQSMPSSGSITRKFGPSWKQSTGQTSTQSIYLHLMQVSVTTNVMTCPSVCPVERLLTSVRRAPFCHSGTSGFQPAAQPGEMMLFAPRRAVFEVLAQGEFAARERQLRPRNLGLAVQADLQTFRPRREFGLQ